jgi:hypothetical protein
MKVVSLSELPTSLLYPQVIFLVPISFRDWVDSKATVWPEGLIQSGLGTRDWMRHPMFPVFLRNLLPVLVRRWREYIPLKWRYISSRLHCHFPEYVKKLTAIQGRVRDFKM